MSEVEGATGGADASSPTVGEMLREGRARLRLSAADVARHLRLSLRQVEALEANDFAALPGNTIVRGFIRNYARLLQMDAAPLLAAYEAALPRDIAAPLGSKSERIDISPRPSRRWLVYLGIVLTLLVGVPWAIYALLHDDDAQPLAPPQSVSPVAPSAGPVTVPMPLPEAAPLPGGGGAPGEGAKPAASAPPVTASSPVQQPAATAAATLHFVFADDAWVEVRDGAGRRIFSQLNRKGSEETLTGAGPFSLVIGNATQVRLTYNGKPVDLAPHIKINVARFTLE